LNGSNHKDRSGSRRIGKPTLVFFFFLNTLLFGLQYFLYRQGGFLQAAIITGVFGFIYSQSFLSSFVLTESTFTVRFPLSLFRSPITFSIDHLKRVWIYSGFSGGIDSIHLLDKEGVVFRYSIFIFRSDIKRLLAALKERNIEVGGFY
jgi:hypothetical protein